MATILSESNLCMNGESKPQSDKDKSDAPDRGRPSKESPLTGDQVVKAIDTSATEASLTLPAPEKKNRRGDKEAEQFSFEAVTGEREASTANHETGSVPCSDFDKVGNHNHSKHGAEREEPRLNDGEHRLSVIQTHADDFEEEIKATARQLESTAFSKGSEHSSASHPDSQSNGDLPGLSELANASSESEPITTAEIERWQVDYRERAASEEEEEKEEDDEEDEHGLYSGYQPKYRPLFVDDKKCDSELPPPAVFFCQRRVTKGRYVFGTEVALAAFIAAAGTARLRADRSLHPIEKVAARVQNPVARRTAISSEEDDIAAIKADSTAANAERQDLPKSSKNRRRQTYRVGPSDTLVAIAERHFNDSGVAWLILDINRQRLLSSRLDGKLVVELQCRQLIELPTAAELSKFKSADRDRAAIEHLITLVVNTRVDDEILTAMLGRVVGDALAVTAVRPQAGQPAVVARSLSKMRFRSAELSRERLDRLRTELLPRIYILALPLLQES